MSSHLVETSEEDSFTAVSRHIGDLLNEGQVMTVLRPIGTRKGMNYPRGNQHADWPVASNPAAPAVVAYP